MHVRGLRGDCGCGCVMHGGRRQQRLSMRGLISRMSHSVSPLPIRGRRVRSGPQGRPFMDPLHITDARTRPAGVTYNTWPEKEGGICSGPQGRSLMALAYCTSRMRANQASRTDVHVQPKSTTQRGDLAWPTLRCVEPWTHAGPEPAGQATGHAETATRRQAIHARRRRTRLVLQLPEPRCHVSAMVPVVIYYANRPSLSQD